MTTICIAGDPQDLSATYVSWMAKKRGMEVLELSENNFGVDWTFSFYDTEVSKGKVNFKGREYAFSDLAGVFVRLNPKPSLPPGLVLSQEEESVFISERRNGLSHFINSLPCIVGNRPNSGRSNGSKAYQMELLRKAGFLIPKWILSNDELASRRFLNAHSNVIYKSCSGLRSRVRLLDESLMKRLREGTSPVIIQEYIAGRDVRVHIVDNEVFPTEITSSGIDYRFEGQQNEFRATSLPDNIAELCKSFTRQEGLTLSGFDFRVTPGGQWYCLESNPVPTFLPYEMSTGQPIAGALLDLFEDQHLKTQ